jgi:general secretion pathway protein G
MHDVRIGDEARIKNYESWGSMKAKVHNSRFTLNHSKYKNGFTLIELLIVIAIIGILAVLILVNLQSALEKARDAKRKDALSNIKTAIELYYQVYGSYPLGTYDMGTAGFTQGYSNDDPTGYIQGLVSANLIKQLPQDPNNPGVDDWFKSYWYASYNNANISGVVYNGWCVAAFLENTNDDWIIEVGGSPLIINDAGERNSNGRGVTVVGNGTYQANCTVY